MRKNEQLIGAAAERKAILRKLRKMTGKSSSIPSRWVIADLIEWLLKRHERYDRAPRGLGRKRKGV